MKNKGQKRLYRYSDADAESSGQLFPGPQAVNVCVVVSSARKPFDDGKFGGKNRAATAEVSGFCAPTHQDTVCPSIRGSVGM